MRNANTNAITHVTAITAMRPTQNVSVPNTSSRVAHAEVYPPTAANAACENANCPETPKTK